MSIDRLLRAVERVEETHPALRPIQITELPQTGQFQVDSGTASVRLTRMSVSVLPVAQLAQVLVSSLGGRATDKEPPIWSTYQAEPTSATTPKAIAGRAQL